MVFCLAPVCASQGKIRSTAVAASHAFSSGLPSIVIREGGSMDFVARQGWLPEQGRTQQQRHRKNSHDTILPERGGASDSAMLPPGARFRATLFAGRTVTLMLKLSCLFVAIAALLSAAESTPLPLWPGTPPGDKGGLGPEKDTTKPTDGLVAGKPVIRLGSVSSPTITLYSAPAAQNTGAAVVVFPGGGYNILALDLEGTEVCEWLNSLGVNCALVKYRVPVRAGLPRHGPPLQDAQRAVGMVRHRAAEWKLDPKRIGVLGFSAGGHLVAALSTNFERVRMTLWTRPTKSVAGPISRC